MIHFIWSDQKEKCAVIIRMSASNVRRNTKLQNSYHPLSYNNK